jgi:hypothetical protein
MTDPSATPPSDRAKPGIHQPFVVRTTPSLVPIPPRTIPNLQTSLPVELHRRGSREEPACPHACSCSRRAETGVNLASLDMGAGRTAAAVRVGENHVHPSVNAPSFSRFRGGDLQNGAIEPHTQRAFRCRTALLRRLPKRSGLGSWAWVRMEGWAWVRMEEGWACW